MVNSEVRRELKKRVDELLEAQYEANTHIDKLADAILELARSGQKIDPTLVVELVKVYVNMKDLSKSITEQLKLVIQELER